MKIRWHAFTFLTVVAICSATLSAQTTVTFQEGVGGYTGTVDRKISISSSTDGSAVDTTTTSFFIDGDPNDSSRADYLIRFENIIGGSGIPAGATILDATLTLRTTSTAASSNSQTGESYNVYRLTQAFDSSSTLDGDFGDMDFIFTPFVDGVEPEQNEADFNVGTFDHEIGGSSMAVDQSYTANVTRAVQSWADGDPNLGIAIMSDHTDNDDGWSVHTTGSSDPSFRPLLSVTYTTDPNTQIVELQNGLDSYAGTTDVFLRDGDVSVDGSTVSEEFLDGSNGTDSFDDPYMIKFDLAGVPSASSVAKAELIIKTGISSGASDSPGAAGVGYSVHQMLTPFTTASMYSDFAGDSAAMELAGEISAAAAIFEDIDEAELVSVDVTSIVHNWLINGDSNHGIYVGALGTSNGWQIFSSGAVDSDLAPMLRLTLVTAGGGGVVVPDSAIVISGVSTAGDVVDLAEADNVDYSIQRSSQSIQSVAEVEVKGVSPTETPSGLSFTIEAAAFARGTPTQTIRMFDFNARMFETIDTRNAARFTDRRDTIVLTGDLSRFIEPGTGCMITRVRYNGSSQRANFTANIDQIIWEVTN